MRNLQWLGLAAVVCLSVGCGGDDGGGTSGTEGASTTGGSTGGGGATGDETGSTSGMGGGTAGETTGGSSGGSTGGATPPEVTCQAGCTATLAADCQNGPASQDICEMDCEELLVGSCATEYETWLQCAAGGSVTCDSNGLPTVEGCEDQQMAFLACVTGG